ncbi:MAG: hypothetical protein Ta2B_28980 [Termitinemataceae bacterium]|nr:MAG: hypothetical protein Ta2B_28980 [Termitinemataceae bacterium]
MRIAIFTDTYWPRVNGVTVSIESFTKSLLKRGHQVLIVCPFYPESSQVANFSLINHDECGSIPESCIMRVPSVAVFASSEDRVSKTHKLFWVKRRISEFAPDIIHIQSEFVTADFGYFCAGTKHIPTVYTFHTLWEEYMRNYFPNVPLFILKLLHKIIVGTAFKRAFRVIIPSLSVRDVALRFKLKREPYLLSTGIDQKLFEHTQNEIDDFRSAMENKYPQLKTTIKHTTAKDETYLAKRRFKSKKILLYAGRIGREKNIDFLFDIAPGILKKHNDVIFFIVGNGPDIIEYKGKCEERNLQNDVIFTGYMDRRILSLTYAIAKIFVFPSLTETQGLVTIEAMFSGLPVVAIGERGTLCVMNGDNGGFMVKNDKNEFTNRIFDLLEDDDLYDKKSAQAKEYAKHWSIDTATEKLENIYREVIEDYQKNNTYPRAQHK